MNPTLSENAREQLAQSFDKTHDETNALLKIIELIVYGGAGFSVGWFWGLLFGCLAFYIVSKRPQVITMKNTAKLINKPIIGLLAGFVISLCYLMTASSLAIVLLQGYVLKKKMDYEGNPSVLLAQRKVDEARSQLETLQKQNAHISQAEIDMAIMSEGKLKIELAQAQKKARKQWDKAHHQWELKKSQFWGKPHPSGISNRQVMSNDCSPKKSPYGGGWMRGAAANLCPEWQALQGNEPKLGDDQTIQEIQTKIERIKPMLAVNDSLQSAEQIITTSLQNQSTLQRHLRGGLDYENGLELFISITQRAWKGFTPELFVFLLVGGVIFILLSVTAITKMLSDTVKFGTYNQGNDTSGGMNLSSLLGTLSKSVYSSNSDDVKLHPVPQPQAVQHTQSVQPTPQSQNVQHTQSVQPAVQRVIIIDDDEENDVPIHLKSYFDAITRDLVSGQLKNLSFNTLEKAYQVKRQFIKELRNLLVERGYAQYDVTNKMVIM